MHVPVGPEQAAQFWLQALQLPVESLKKPWAQSLQSFDPALEEVNVVQPGAHVQPPEPSHVPLSQLQVEGALLAGGERHFPEPCGPSSQDVQPSGQAWHWGPKNPEAQVSQDEPVNPGLQTHAPWELHCPPAVHGVAHVVDSTSRRVAWPFWSVKRPEGN